MSDDVLSALRLLHQPVDSYGYLTCEGCDFGGYEAESPAWPCRTAEEIYSGGEVHEILEAQKLADQWKRERRKAWPKPAGSGLSGLLAPVYDRYIKAMIEAAPLYRLLAK